MNSTIVKIKIFEHGKDLHMPQYATEGSAGMDLMAAIDRDILIRPDSAPILVETGIAIKLRAGYEAQIRSRSGLAIKNGIVVANSPGTIDSDYIGEIKVILMNIGKDAFVIKRGQRIAQMVISQYYKAIFDEVQDLKQTKRGNGGFGSTGL